MRLEGLYVTQNESASGTIDPDPAKPASAPATLPNKFAGLTKEQIVAAIADAIRRDASLSGEPRIQAAMRFQMKAHSGPLPAPEDFAEYEHHCPGGADRILKMAEAAQQHQFEMDRTGLNKSFTEARIGQFFGLAIGLSGIGGGVACILLDHAVGGTILSGASLVALVTVFVKGRGSGD
jgi:uncharacterized membrane protein